MAVCPPQVWQEDNILRGNVDPPAPVNNLSICGQVPLFFLSSEFHRRNGCVLCLPITMVRINLIIASITFSNQKIQTINFMHYYSHSNNYYDVVQFT